MKRCFIIASCLVLLGATPKFAASWRGIVPLRSTRDDIRQLLGTPTRHGDFYDDYERLRYTVSVEYATENIFTPGDDCNGPAPYWWGEYHVSVGTVLSVLVSFDRDIPLSKFRIPNLNKLTKGEPGDTLTIDYFDKKRGLQYSIRDKRVHTIQYGPSAISDIALRCAPDRDADAREAHVNQICKRLFGSMIDQRLNLYGINPSYALHLTFDRHGDVIALDVEPRYIYDWWHTDWEQRDDFPHLSKSEYDRLLAQVDQIKQRGPLIGTVTTNPDGSREQQYREGVLRWEEMTGSERSSDARTIRLFHFYYLKRPAT